MIAYRVVTLAYALIVGFAVALDAHCTATVVSLMLIAFIGDSVITAIKEKK